MVHDGSAAGTTNRLHHAYLGLGAASLCNRGVSVDAAAIVTAAADGGGCLGNAAAVVLPPLVRAGDGAVEPV